MEKKELARFLYRNIEIGETIPESLYTAIAEVLAYVYKVRKKFKSILQSATPAHEGGAKA
jgi:flagellar biosynthetic protein FlhB